MARPRRSAAQAAQVALARDDSESDSDLSPPPSPPRPAPKRGRPAAPVDAIESDSSLSELSEEEEAQPAAKRVRQVKSAVDVTTLGDNEIFQAVMQANNLDDAAENWIVGFQSDSGEALSQLLTFLLRLCGCGESVSREEALDRENMDTILERLQTEVAQHASAQYPIVSRNKTMKGIRRSTREFLDKLFSGASEADMLGDEDFLETWLQWLIGMSVSSLRSFRHTATVVALWTVGALSYQLEQVREHYDVAVKQRDAEAKRDGGNRTRLAHTAERMEQLDALRDSLDAHLNELQMQVFDPRSRDFDAAIRLDCMECLGQWMTSYPSQYLQDFYFRHIGSALQDPDVHVRLSTLKTVQAICKPVNAIQLVPLAEAQKKRMVDIALYDVNLSVRTTAFSALESLNKQDMLSNEDRAALAVHIFDKEAPIRKAAASFLVGLLETDVAHSSDVPESMAHVYGLLCLLAKYDQQLKQHDTVPLDANDFDLVKPKLGRIHVAMEALWDATEFVHPWQSYIDLLHDESAPELDAAQEAIAVEMLASVMQILQARHEQDSESLEWEAYSTSMMDALPKLLAKYAGDAARISDLLLIIPAMDLGVYHETRNEQAWDSLWDDVCGHFMRHVDASLLQHAADALHLFLISPTDTSVNGAKLLALQETVLNKLQDTLYQRQVDATVFTEDDVHNLHASLARLHALLKVVDVHTLLDDDLWDQVMALARRGRLNYPQEKQFVRLALQSLALSIMWATKALLKDDDQATPMEKLLHRRDALLDMATSYLDVGSHVQSTSWQVVVMLYTLFFTMHGKDATENEHAMHLVCPREIQQRCASVFASEMHALIPAFHENATSNASRKTTIAMLEPSLLSLHLYLCSMTSTFVAALQVGAFSVSHASAMLQYYAQFGHDYDTMCHEVISVLRDDALHSERDWLVAETIVETLKGSFAVFSLYGDDVMEAHYIALARQLANATMVRGPGFTVLESLNGSAMVTLHVAAIQQFIQYMQDSDNDEKTPVFFKGLSQLLTTLKPADAMTVHSTMHQRLAAAQIEPVSGAKAWDAFFSYDKRLLNVAAKDDSIVKEAQHYSAA